MAALGCLLLLLLLLLEQSHCAGHCHLHVLLLYCSSKRRALLALRPLNIG
jgi:hypothetical protein